MSLFIKRATEANHSSRSLVKSDRSKFLNLHFTLFERAICFVRDLNHFFWLCFYKNKTKKSESLFLKEQQEQLTREFYNNPLQFHRLPKYKNTIFSAW